MKMGIGVAPFAYWQTDQKTSSFVSPLIMVPPPRRAGITYDVAGWPTGIPTVVGNSGWYLMGSEGYLRPGRYRLIGRGSGKICFGHPDVPNRGNFTVTSPGGDGYSTVCEFDLKTTSIRSMVLIFTTDPSNHLRDLKCHHVDDDPEYLFSRQYVHELSYFDTLRLAAWPGVIASKDQDWPKDPGNPFSPAQKWLAGFALCGATKTNPWINIPHMATDAYTTEVAKLAQSLLTGRGVKVYIEYSIEVWNWGYPFAVATDWVRKWGLARTPPISDYQCSYAELAHRHQQTFMTHAPGLEAVRILSDQFGWPALCQNAFAWADKNGYRFDAVATAPYVDAPGLDWHALDGLMVAASGDPASGPFQDALDQVFAGFRRGLTNLKEQAGIYAALAKKHGCRNITYEIGPSWTLPGNAPPDRMALYNQAHRDPRMLDFLHGEYYPFLANFYDLAMYTQHTSRPSPGAFWGIRANCGETPCPKLEATIRWCQENNGRAPSAWG